MELRPYQNEAVNAVYEHLRMRSDNPCIVLPTGTGKSLVIAQIASDAVIKWQGRVLILAHVKELLEQNADKIQKLCPALKVGVFSAGLKSRDTKESVIVAGIQSVYDKACDLGKFDLVIIDEAHLIPGDGEGMYRSFLKDMTVINPNVRLIGLTATPYRLKGGLICKPENLLNEVCYEAGLKEMIHNGYLSPLVSKAGRAEAKLGDLHIRGGEFIADEVEKAMDNTELVTAACREIVDLTLERKSVLIFASSVDHCKHVAEAITRFSQQECAIVTGNTNADDRNTIIERFKGNAVKKDFFNYYSPLKFLANVNVLTTGFDAPNADCIVLLRPTNSAGLLVQMIGRGTRLSPATNKVNCLILDYGENILRHGPVDMIKIKEKSGDKGISAAPAKKCPKCQSIFHASYMKCPDCGYEFPPPVFHHNTTASNAGVLSGEISSATFPVKDVFFTTHRKKGAKDGDPTTVRIDYFCGVDAIKSEWICPEHVGFARNKFEKWWRERAPAGCSFPKTAAETVNLANSGILADTLEITVRTITGDPFERITDYKLGEKKLISEDEIKFADADEYQSYEDVPIEDNNTSQKIQDDMYQATGTDPFEVTDDDIPF